MRAPLNGIRILDLTRVLAGPLATMTLGDLGAQVIKVERPGIGDETRAWGPPFDERGESAYYLAVNRNKLSIALDLDDAADIQTLSSLLHEADAVLDNFRPGTLERRGIDVDALLTQRPHLVWCTLTGFGPESKRPGYDFVIQAESGWMAITGEPHGTPMKVGVALADVLAGKDAAVAVLAGLAARGDARPASARRYFISLFGTAVSSLVNVAQNALVTAAEAKRWGNAHPNLVPYQLFMAADRPMVIAVGNDSQWRHCVRALGLDALASDPRLATNAGRLAHRQLVVDAVAERVRARPAAEWLELLSAAGVPAGVVRTVREALADVGASALTGVAPAPPGTIRLAPPRLDEHGALVRRFGWDAFRHAASVAPSEHALP
ncbi:MAG TPA: CoA transferase [Gemmatimonadaceae bacterium]|jgi:crotonobetainyl-CoA:carnitine CoA-transferase CaiB-like acyl-CoA transferase|nr:CoA transferase [Gemmatimonadaceae bacterium]